MIGRLHGTIITTNRTPLIVDVGGVGYLVHVTQTEANRIKAGSQGILFIHTHVRDDTLDLYGFAEAEDLALFELLLTVSGIGPKTALSIIERGARSISRAVLAADTDFFTTIPRLGKKNAQKIIIELKNKLGGLKDIDLTGDELSETTQLVSALTSMGFERRDVVEIIPKLASEDSIENKIRKGLKLLGKSKHYG